MPQAGRFWKRRLKVTPDHRRFEKFELLVLFFFFFSPNQLPTSEPTTVMSTF